jgi:hypothetical protein
LRPKELHGLACPTGQATWPVYPDFAAHERVAQSLLDRGVDPADLRDLAATDDGPMELVTLWWDTATAR